MKKLIIFIVVCLFTSSCTFAAGVSKKSDKTVAEIEIETKDGYVLASKLFFPKEKRKKYPLVVLLHSIGYSSAYWLNIQTKFQKAGFAVLTVDFRGHGKSIYNSSFRKVNWLYMPETSYLRYPNDILDLLVYVNDNYKNVAVSHMAFVGADIGANTAILVSTKLQTKPVAIAMISPAIKFKGLYIPIALAELGNVPMYAAYSEKDRHSKTQVFYLKKFAQGNFDIHPYPYGGIGMLMLKVNHNMDVDIVNWVVSQFNNSVKK